jgi:hypothetical protein
MTLNKPLAKNLRSQLENTVKTARDVAEKAAHSALTHLGVGESEAPSHLTEDQKALRRRLRAHGRQLGDIKHANGTQPIRHLVWEVAYEHWHRMLFARFLAENHLLMYEPGVAVTLAECEDLAQDPITNLGAKSGWELAAILAARMLPQVFKPHSPVFELRFSPNERRDLELLLKGLPTDTFYASDSLGWVYQFWQAKRKDEVNASEVKIGADELPAVTQLFTEPYMVDFLLHNSLGAWWHTRHPNQVCPVELTYFRTLDDGTPAAGKFEGWPDSLADFTLLDPCCGSGHFLVAAFLMLVPMRMISEGLSAKDAVDTVLADNLHGLEVDPRCVEIAVFAVALASWRYPDESGKPLGVRTEMPAPNIACCGLEVASKAEDWEALVPTNLSNSDFLRQDLRLLHSSFAQAPLLGSLLDPSKTLKKDLASSSADGLQGFLERALSRELLAKVNEESQDAWDFALIAQGLLKAAIILEGRYHLVITNVPYLSRGKQNEQLQEYCDKHYNRAKFDLANVFLERCLELSKSNSAGAVQVVMPQNWLFLSSYRRQREQLLSTVSWSQLIKLGGGAEAFSNGPGNITNICMFTCINGHQVDGFIQGMDVTSSKSPEEKAKVLIEKPLTAFQQKSQFLNPDARVTLEAASSEKLLEEYAFSSIGLSTSDTPLFVQFFWEHLDIGGKWEFHQSTSEFIAEWSGCSNVVLYENGCGKMRQLAAAQDRDRGRDKQGVNAWGKPGVAVGLIGNLPATLYLGNKFDNNIGILTPYKIENLAPIWCYCSSNEYVSAVRRIDQKLNVTNGTLAKVPFDLDFWKQVAAEKYPNGLPKPYSDDPTQWIFHGHPRMATDSLQVGIARLLGYTWPAESDTKMELSDEARTWIERCKDLASDVDDDGIVCLRAVRGEKPAHERLLTLLINAWETFEPGSWKASVLDKLLADADSAGKGLDVWLQEKFFEQHAKLFQHRPFIWHVWDGLKDGFSALVNYHKLDTKNLERLIHTYLGDWIRIQESEVTKDIDGAVLRLAAAQALKKKLEAILEGEAPFDIFVRWKSAEQQSIGWNPDLNDGVRMNVRPFMSAEVLRHNKKSKLNITWDKDRGKDVISAPWFKTFEGERINDHHLTLLEKKAARDKAVK